MTLIAIGLNHRSAPLDVLERVALPAELLPKALAELTSGEFVNEAVVLSTCNRTEVYVHGERFHDAYREVRDGLAVLAGVDPGEFSDHLYVHYHDEATRHLFAVAAGLDSAVLGEHEILGQVRTAWETARLEGTCGTLLDPVFAHAIRTGKRVRTDTAIGRRTASLSHAAVSLIGERLGSVDGKRILLVGTGEVGTGVALALNKSVDIDLVVSNRTPSRATAVADSLGGRVAPFDQLRDAICDADVVISATGATGTVIDADWVAQAVHADRTERLLILDLAVPRDVDPGVLAFDAVDLLVLSDLQAFANRGMEERQKEAVAAGRIVDEEIEGFRDRSSAREVSPLLGSLHRLAEDIRVTEVERQQHRAPADPKTDEAVDAVTRAIVAKLLHEPSRQLRSAAGSRRGDRLAEALRELFDLS